MEDGDLSAMNLMVGWLPLVTFINKFYQTLLSMWPHYKRIVHVSHHHICGLLCGVRKELVL